MKIVGESIFFFCVSGLRLCFNFDTKNFKIFSGSKESQFGYTVQQHEAGGHQWWESQSTIHQHTQKPVPTGFLELMKPVWTGPLVYRN